MHIVVDGIDGSGKGVIVDCLEEELKRKGKKVFDARQFMRQRGLVPASKDFSRASVIVTTEPTYAWAGLALREALVRDPAYDPITVAQAFAVDREIHYRRLVLPALKARKLVLSERGVSGSLAYQVTAGIPEKTILALPGNKLALGRPPDILIIATVRPEIAIARLAARSGKDDGSYYERKPFLQKLARRYASARFRAIFSRRGTKVLELSTEGDIGETKQRVRTLLASFALTR